MATKSPKKEKKPNNEIYLDFTLRFEQFKKELTSLLDKYSFVQVAKMRITERGIFPIVDIEEKPKEQNEGK